MCQKDSERVFPIFFRRYEWPYFLGRRDQRGSCIQKNCRQYRNGYERETKVSKAWEVNVGEEAKTSAAHRALLMRTLDAVPFCRETSH